MSVKKLLRDNQICSDQQRIANKSVMSSNVDLNDLLQIYPPDEGTMNTTTINTVRGAPYITTSYKHKGIAIDHRYAQPWAWADIDGYKFWKSLTSYNYKWRGAGILFRSSPIDLELFAQINRKKEEELRAGRKKKAIRTPEDAVRGILDELERKHKKFNNDIKVWLHTGSLPMMITIEKPHTVIMKFAYVEVAKLTLADPKFNQKFANILYRADNCIQYIREGNH